MKNRDFRLTPLEDIRAVIFTTEPDQWPIGWCKQILQKSPLCICLSELKRVTNGQTDGKAISIAERLLQNAG